MAEHAPHTCPYPASGCTSPKCPITAARAAEIEAEREFKRAYRSGSICGRTDV